MEYRILKEDELMHHGILGMAWGHRNGPPYPLDAGDHSASEKRAGWRDSLDKKKSRLEKKYEKKIRKAERLESNVSIRRAANRNSISQMHDAKIQKEKNDRDSFKPIKDGLKTRNGKELLTKEDVARSMDYYNNRMKEARENKKAALKDFDKGSKYVNAGFKEYKNVISNYKNVKIKALDDPSYKSSSEYKKAKKAFKMQQISDFMYNNTGTILLYSSKKGREDIEKKNK